MNLALSLVRVTVTVLAVTLPRSIHGDTLAETFSSPPTSAHPGVYWYFHDGNQDRDAMTADLEAMKQVGIHNVVFLEVNVGVPRGPVEFMSEPWQENFAHAVRTAERLGIELTLGTGPGWAGSGGPWITPPDSMQQLAGQRIEVEGPDTFNERLPIPPPPETSRFAGMSPEHKLLRDQWYRDVAVLAYPSPSTEVGTIDLVNLKTLTVVEPYSIQKSAPRYVPMDGRYEDANKESTGTAGALDPAHVVDLSDQMNADGTLNWIIPPGKWTILRFVARTSGQTTRPAPAPGHGFECDKFSAAAYEKQWSNFQAKLLEKVKPGTDGQGWTRIHLDSWEMSSQNWTDGFREAFTLRRGYDPQPYFPAYMGLVVGDRERTERFLWDMRKTAQELVLENYAGTIQRIAHDHGMLYSNEPYDMNPAGDLDLGSVADIPMCEFWHPGGPDAVYGCVEAVSIAHVMGKPLVKAEAFTTSLGDARFEQYPGLMKNQTDWALALGINGFVFHTFAHQPLGDDFQPGMYFGDWGVNWHRYQTWWEMLPAYHRYIACCSHLLRQGEAVADVLYLIPEGAPHIFLPPPSAMEGTDTLRDKKGYSFDAVSPRLLEKFAVVEAGRIAFPGGSRYRLLVLPSEPTMTPETLATVARLVQAGATVVGNPPKASPSLVGFPKCDDQVRQLAAKLWGDSPAPDNISSRTYDMGTIYWGGALSSDTRLEDTVDKQNLYPAYEATAQVLQSLGLPEDFRSTNSSLRFIHRRTNGKDLYFVSNRTAQPQHVDGVFRAHGGRPELWDPNTGQRRALPEFTAASQTTTVPLQFAPNQSYFVVFSRDESIPAETTTNFPTYRTVGTLDGAWSVDFDPQRGGPGRIEFPMLTDWTSHEQRGVQYYSGIGTYRKSFDLPPAITSNDELFLDLGQFFEMACVSLNGRQLGVVWSQPHRISLGTNLKTEGNELVIEVANSWENRLLGDQTPEDRHARQVHWPSGLLGGESFHTGRYTFTTLRTITAKELRPSGLLGPVQLLQQEAEK